LRVRLRIAPALGLALLGALALAPPTSPATKSAVDMAAARETAVRWGLQQNGTRERGTSNCSPRVNRWVRDMGLRPCQLWCGAFVHQAFLQGGVRLSARLIDPHRAYDDVIANRRGLQHIPMSRVRRGDILFYAFRPRLKASHLAIVVTNPRKRWVTTVEGNVEHAVRVNRRHLRYPVLAARVVGPGA
jgi:cell wall-associated NlpC family hydrolase